MQSLQRCSKETNSLERYAFLESWLKEINGTSTIIVRISLQNLISGYFSH